MLGNVPKLELLEGLVGWKGESPYGGRFKLISLTRWLTEDRNEDVMFLREESQVRFFLKKNEI